MIVSCSATAAAQAALSESKCLPSLPNGNRLTIRTVAADLGAVFVAGGCGSEPPDLEAEFVSGAGGPLDDDGWPVRTSGGIFGAI